MNFLLVQNGYIDVENVDVLKNFKTIDYEVR